MTNLTKQQQAAVASRGGALLVSAGAGSGKTKVLVERLLGFISGAEGCDITDFLVITYTRAAAAELRSRILDAISDKLAGEPDNRHLRRQAALCHEAHIGTIHGFCSDLLREMPHLIGLPPAFRVADESEAVLLRDSVLEALLEARYETISETPDFSLLVDTMSAGRDDKKLKQIVLEAHSKLQSHADPIGWVKDQLPVLEALPLPDAYETVWGRYLMDNAASAVRHWLLVLQNLRDTMLAYSDFEKAYGASVEASLDGAGRFLAALGRGWDEARAAANVDFPRAKAAGGYDDLKAVRTKCRDALKKIAAVFECTSAEHMEDMVAVRPAVKALLELVLQFDAAYADEKRKRGLADFSDLEHLTARLLVDFETQTRTETAMSVSGRYREILVDEYQDVSRVQELIFGAVSDNGSNLFLVGDVKQSIYRFRLADPSIFLSKYKAYADMPDVAEVGDVAEPAVTARRVLLTANFRSKAGILDAVNFIFRNIMSESFGEMDYTEREFLVPGRTDAAAEPSGGAESSFGREPAVELDILDLSGIETAEDEEDPEKSAVEADFVARRIEELLKSGKTVPDAGGGTRPLDCGDIAVLLRSVRNKSAVYEKALTDRGIPAARTSGEGFFESMEVSVAVSLLSIIDNPVQDIPLIAVLRSPLYGFTPDELAQIRLADKTGDFYGALTAAALTNIKAKAFLDELNELRRDAPELPADRFLWHVYAKTGMLGIMGALRDGRTRRQNLMRFYELAVRSQQNGYRGLFGFVTLLRRLIENGEEPFGDGDSPTSGAVRLMSIHKSKGLEFPIVILADTAKRFNRRDAAAPLLIHPDFGVGARRADLERRIEYPTLARLAVAKKLTREMLSEELRILYVALTRAREKLIIVASFADASKELQKLAKDAASPVAPQVLESVQSPSGFILLPVLTRPEARVLLPTEPDGDSGIPDGDIGFAWDIRRVDITEKPQTTYRAPDDGPEPAAASPEAVEAVRSTLEYVYPYEAAALIPSKLTATGLKGRFADFEAAEEAQTPEYVKRDLPPALRPNFIAEKTDLTPAERGTALHLAMQYIDYGKCLTPEGVSRELLRLADMTFITARQAAAVEPRKIAAFFSSPLGRRILVSKKLYREFKFSLLIRAEEYYPEDTADDEILFQGVVDCCFEEEGKLHVVDFKTDRVTRETLEEKKRLYAPQLIAYGRAMERITGIPAGSRTIYFFSLGEAVEILEI